MTESLTIIQDTFRRTVGDTATEVTRTFCGWWRTGREGYQGLRHAERTQGGGALPAHLQVLHTAPLPHAHLST